MKKNFITALTLMVFALICAALLASINALTKDVKAERAKKDLAESLFKVANVDKTLYTAEEDTAFVTDDTVKGVYAIKKDNNIEYVAFVIDGNGYAGTFEMMVVLDKDAKIVNSKVLSTSETKINKNMESDFSAMNGKDVINDDVFNVKSGTTYTYTAAYTIFNTAIHFGRLYMGGND